MGPIFAVIAFARAGRCEISGRPYFCCSGQRARRKNHETDGEDQPQGVTGVHVRQQIPNRPR
jgi:hypothetical protein